MTASGPSGRAVAGLRLLLANASEFAVFERLPARERVAAAAPLPCLETDKLVSQVLRSLCTDAMHPSNTQQAHSAAHRGGDGEERLDTSSSMAKAYRECRSRLLRRAVEHIDKCERLSSEVGAIVETLDDGWLARQEHALLRDMNNLGF